VCACDGRSTVSMRLQRDCGCVGVVSVTQVDSTGYVPDVSFR
jgi:hypothetical protein